MTEFQDINDFMQDIENPVYSIRVDRAYTLQVDLENDDIPEDASDREIKEMVKEDTARHLNENVEFEADDIIVTKGDMF